MAHKTANRVLSDALADLNKYDMELFCSALVDRRDEPRVRRNAIENKSVADIADKLVATLTEEGAVDVTLKILREICCNKTAEELKDCWMKQPKAEPVPGAPGSVSKQPGATASVQEQAATGLKDKVDSNIKSLVDRMNEYKDFEITYKKVIQHNKKQKDSIEKRIQADYRNMRQFLKEDEEARLEAVREEEKQKAETVREQLKILEEHNLYIKKKIPSLRKEKENPIVKDITILCQTKELQLEKGLLLNEAEHLGNLAYEVGGKIKEMFKFTPVILDPNTAFPWLSLSPDLTSVSCPGNKQQELPNTPERFMKNNVVLGSEGFSSGRHSWVVEVGDHPDWSIGLAKETVDRKAEREPPFSPEYGMWCLEHSGGKYTNGCETITFKRNPQKIRVHLDYEGGEVSFHDTEDMARIYSHKCIFTEKLYPFFAIREAGGSQTTDIKVCKVETSL